MSKAKPRKGKFRSISSKIQLKLDNKTKTPTALYYQKGFVGDNIALRFFKNEKIIRTLSSKNLKKWNKINNNSHSSNSNGLLEENPA